MSQSTSDPTGGELFQNERPTRQGSISRYDLLLAVIPLVFLIAAVFGALLSVPLNLSLFGAALVGAVAVVDGVFWNPPV